MQHQFIESFRISWHKFLKGVGGLGDPPHKLWRSYRGAIVSPSGVVGKPAR